MSEVKRLTPEQTEEIRARAEAATPGPWRAMADGNQYINTRYFPTAKCVGCARVDGLVRPWNPHALVAFGFDPKEYETARFLEPDATFIAHARSDIPALLAEIAALKEERFSEDEALEAMDDAVLERPAALERRRAILQRIRAARKP